MKKLLLVGASLSCFTFVAADDSACSGIASGFYVGGGISFINDGTKVEATTPDLYENKIDIDLLQQVDDKYVPGAGNEDKDPWGEFDAEKKLMADVANDAGNDWKVDKEELPISFQGRSYTQVNHSNTKIGGTFLVGYQKVLNNIPVCLGIEIGGDFSQRNEVLNADRIVGRDNKGDYYDSKVSRNGCIPFAALKIGYVNAGSQLMPYFKVGVSRVETKESYVAGKWNGARDYVAQYMKDHTSEFKFSSWKPTFTVGLEKNLDKNLNARFEIEYRVSKDKLKNFTDTQEQAPNYDEQDNVESVSFYTEHGGGKKITQKSSFTVRALVTYNVRM